MSVQSLERESPPSGLGSGLGTAATWLLVAYGLALLALWFGPLGQRALINADEGRYATIALEMLRSGDWVTPRLNGLLYFEKPALPYWLGALSLAVFGVNEFAARLWPATAGMLSVLAVGFTASRLWGRDAGLHAGLVMAGSVWIIANSHFLTLDTGLCFFLTVALCGFLLAQRDAAPRAAQRNWMWLTWAALAGATLTKGLVALVIPGGALLLYCLVQRQWHLLRQMHWSGGVPIYLLLAAPWFILVSIRNPAFFDFFFINEHFRRYLTDEARRLGPIWYFVPYLLVGLLPWTLLLPAATRQSLRGEAGSRFQPLRLALLWAAFIFVFFSISRSKLPSYILPMFPALALILGCYLAGANARRLSWLLVPLSLITGLGMLILPAFVDRFDSVDTPLSVLEPLARAIALGGAVLIVAGLLAAWALRRRQTLAAIMLLSIASVGGVTAIMIGHDSYGQLKSSRAIVIALAPELKPDTPVFAVRAYDQTLPFYLDRTVTLVDYVDEFAFGEKQEPWRWIPDLEGFIERWRAAPGAAAYMAPDTYRELLARKLPMRIIYQDPRRMMVIKP